MTEEPEEEEDKPTLLDTLKGTRSSQKAYVQTKIFNLQEAPG